MASPQLEDGHTRIANELLDRLIIQHLSPNQWKVLLFVIRKTYGFRKKMDHITNSQIVKGTGIYKTHVSRTIQELVDRRILTKIDKLIGLQKDYELWIQKLPVAVTINTEVTSSGNNNENQELPVAVTELPVAVTELPVAVTKVTSLGVTQKKKEKTKETTKRNYGEFNNVLLTDDEYQKLRDRLNSKATGEFIERLSTYMKSTGKTYKDHYATILNWQRREKEGKDGEVKNSRELPKTYTPTTSYDDL